MNQVLSVFSVSVALRVVRLVANVVLIGLLGRYLGEGGMGLLLSGQATITVLLCVAEIGFGRISVRELAKLQHEERLILGATFYSRLVAGLILFAVVALAAAALPVTERWILWIYALLLPTHCLSELGAWLEARHQLVKTVRAQLAGFTVGAAVTLVAVWKGAPVVVFPLVYLIECWVTAAIQWRYFRRAGGRISQWKWTAPRAFSLIRESWPEMLAQLALMLLFRIDTVMVRILGGAEAAGTYGGAVRVSEVLYFIPATLAAIMLPRLVAPVADGNHEVASDVTLEKRRLQFGSYFAASWLMGLGGAALLASASGMIVRILWKDGFAESPSILVIHAWAFIPYALGVARTQYLTVESKLWANFPSVVLALAVNIILNWLWIPQWLGVGAAWATLIAYTVAWVLTAWWIPALRPSGRLMLEGLAGIPELFKRFGGALLRGHGNSRSRNSR